MSETGYSNWSIGNPDTYGITGFSLCKKDELSSLSPLFITEEEPFWIMSVWTLIGEAGGSIMGIEEVMDRGAKAELHLPGN